MMIGFLYLWMQSITIMTVSMIERYAKDASARTGNKKNLKNKFVFFVKVRKRKKKCAIK